MIHPQPKMPKPVRDAGYKKRLKTIPCAVYGKVKGSGCWSDEWVLMTAGFAFFISDPAHGHKAIGGRIKVDDSSCIPLCRRHHEEQELNMDRFDEKYGINRHALATQLYQQYQEEKGMGTSAKDLIENFTLTPEMRDWASRKAPSVNLDEELEAWKDRCRLQDYRSKVGRIADPAASFRTACRNAEQWGTYRKQPGFGLRRGEDSVRKEE